jgi:hypothetical protein
MISCWHNHNGLPFRQTDLNRSSHSPGVAHTYDIKVPEWLQDCELTHTVFDYTADADIFPPCVSFFGRPHEDRVTVLGIRLESASGVFAHSDFVERSMRNISQLLSGTPKGIDHMLPVAWISCEQHQGSTYVNNNQVSGHLRKLLSRKQTQEIHTLLLDFVEQRQPVKVAHHTSIAHWIQQHGRQGQRYMQFPYTSRVMRGWIKVEEYGWLWWTRPLVR